MANFFEEPLVFPNIISGTSISSYECRINMGNFGNFHHNDSTILPLLDESPTITDPLNDDDFFKDDTLPLSPQEEVSSTNFGNQISNQNLINTFTDIFRQNKDKIYQFNQKFFDFFQELRDSNSIQQFLSTNAITIQHNINIWELNTNNENQTKEYNDFLLKLWFIPISELYAFLSLNSFLPCSIPKSCPICQNTFNTTFNLYQHINENHSNVNDNMCPIIGSNILSLPTYIIELYLKYPKLIPSPFKLSEIIENHQVLECKCPFDCDRMSSSIHEYYLHLESHYQFNDGMNFSTALEVCSEFWAKTQLLIKFNSKIPSLFEIMEFNIKSETINGPVAIALNKQNVINDSFMKNFMNINESINDMKNNFQICQNENKESIENLKNVIERCNYNINEINGNYHNHYNDQQSINTNNSSNNESQQLNITELKKETGIIKEVCTNLWNKFNELTKEMDDIKTHNSIKIKENQLYLSEKEIKIQELNQILKNQSEELKLKDINHQKEINLLILNNNQEHNLMKEKMDTMEFQIQKLENYNIMKKKTKEEEEIKALQKKLKMDKDALDTMKTEILDLKKTIHVIQEENQRIKLVQESSNNIKDDILNINTSIMKKYKELKNDIEIIKSNFTIQNSKTLKMIKTNTTNILEDHNMFKDLFNKLNVQVDISLDKYHQLQTSLVKHSNEEKNEINRNIYMIKQKLLEFEDALQINRKGLNETYFMKLNDLNSINEEKFAFIDESLTKFISMSKDSFDVMNIKLNKIELNQKNPNDKVINKKLQNELISFKDDMKQLKETFHQTFDSLSNAISTQDNKIERIKQNTELEHCKLSKILRENISIEDLIKDTISKQLKYNDVLLHSEERFETLINKMNEMEQNLYGTIKKQEEKLLDQLRINSHRLELNQSTFEKETRKDKNVNESSYIRNNKEQLQLKTKPPNKFRWSPSSKWIKESNLESAIDNDVFRNSPQASQSEFGHGNNDDTYDNNENNNVNNDNENNENNNNNNNENNNNNNNNNENNNNNNGDDEDDHENDNTRNVEAIEDEEVLLIKELIKELKEVETEYDIRTIIIKYKDKDWSMYKDRHELNDGNIPIIIKSFMTKNTPCPARYSCIICQNTFKASSTLAKHMDTIHPLLDKNSSTFGNACAIIYDKKHKWYSADLDQSFDLTECTDPNCAEIESSNGRRGHLNRMHKELNALIQKIGYFWATMVMWSRSKEKLPSLEDIYYSRRCVFCTKCNEFIGSNNLAVTRHQTSAHPETRQQNYQRNMNRKTITIYSTLLHDENELAQFRNDIINQENMEIERRERRRRTDEEEERIQSKRNEILNRENEEVGRIEERRRNEQEEQIENNSEIVNDNVHSNEREYSQERSLEIEEFLKEARNWINEDELEEEKGISFKKFNDYQLKKLKQPIQDLFTKDIKQLLNRIDQISNKDDKWICLEGVLSKVKIEIRKTIRDSLHLSLKDQNIKKKRKSASEINQMLETTRLCRKTRKLLKIISDLKKINVIKGDEDYENLSDQSQSDISALVNKIILWINKHKEDENEIIERVFNTGQPEDIWKIVNDTEEHRSNKIDFIQSQIVFINEKINENQKHLNKFLRELYSKDPRKTVRWFIEPKESHINEIDLETLVTHYSNEWKYKEDYLEAAIGSKWSLNMKIDHDLWKEIKNDLLDKKLIHEAVRSRSNLAACGLDGIHNSIWKMGNDITDELILNLIDLGIQTQKSPICFKRSKTIFIYKKGDAKNPTSWRPISLSTTIYRIIMCHVSKCMTKQSTRLFSKSQKWFVNSNNGISEHINNINDLIANAQRNDKDIHIVTIDLKMRLGLLHTK